jgi:hypothetical protein
MALMPHADLYGILARLLPPAAYMAALWADPQMWRRTRPVCGAKRLPTPAELVRLHAERAIEADVLRDVDAGLFFLSGPTLLFLLNGHPIVGAADVVYVWRDAVEETAMLRTDVAREAFHSMRELMSKAARMPFAANLYGGGRLMVKDLRSVVTRTCYITPDAFASNIHVHEEPRLEEMVHGIRSDMTYYRLRGYGIRVLPPSPLPPFMDNPMLRVTSRICKRYLGRNNPRACLLTSECACYERKFGDAWPSCMSKHNCGCEHHVEWKQRAEQAWRTDMRAKMSDEWCKLWEPLVTDPAVPFQQQQQQQQHSLTVVKRLRFE